MVLNRFEVPGSAAVLATKLVEFSARVCGPVLHAAAAAAAADVAAACPQTSE